MTNRLIGAHAGAFPVLLAMLSLIGCTPIPIESSGEDYGCNRPPPSTFTQAGVDASFAQSTFGEIIVGTIEVETSPAVVTLASKAATDDQIRGYTRCLLIRRDGFSSEQAAYFDQLTAMLQTDPRPSAEQLSAWMDAHPFPGEKPEIGAENSDS